MVEQTHESLVQRWGEILEEYDYIPKIKKISDIYPDKKSLKVNFDHIDHYDSDMSALLLTSPDKMLKAGEEAILEYVPPTEEGVKINLRVMGIPKDLRVEVRNIRSKHLGNFLSVEGVVKRASEVRPRMYKAVFKCARCGFHSVIIQDDVILHEPMECPSDGGGCGRPKGGTRFVPVVEQSTFLDTQRVEIQERPEKLRGGALAQYLYSEIEGDLTGMTFPGDRIVMNGVLKTRMNRKNREAMTLFDIYLEVNSIEVLEAEFDEIEITDEEQEKIDALAADQDIYSKLIRSISPTIYGLEIEKEALILQLFGGVAKKMPDGTKIRGDIHILLVGDPGTAKSQLLSYMAEITPRGVFASGRASTAAGLTAAAVKDEKGDGRWVLEAGALVLADKGLACIDELDKMTKEASSSMHEAMEQQRISVAKAGINATLQSRCSVLGAANPKAGRFDINDYIFDQINMPMTLLSRFDMIFPFMDIPGEKLDSKIASHILKSHLLGEMIQNREQAETGADEDIDKDFADLLEAQEPDIEKDLLRKYVYAAKRIQPILTESAIEVLKNYYLEVRKMGEEGSVPITARQLEAFVRLAEASARGRMSEEVTIDDAERAIRITKVYFTRVLGRGDYSAIDSDVISTGKPKALRDRMNEVNNIISELLKMSPAGFSEDDYISMALDRGITETEAIKLYDQMRRNGQIYQSGIVNGKPVYSKVYDHRL
ncbi:MAG: minichromosome maintenance protein MCM [Thermoplasmata archaeon]|nr:minichromosome maintenance protein MCM [Thermoplasmata archaeon]